MNPLDTLDQALLDCLQADFALDVQPFACLGRSLGLGQDEVLARVQRMKETGYIRQIGAIFDTRRLGYQSTLVAFAVLAGHLETVAATVSAHPGVSHNYARPHHYNLWFTLAVPPGQDLETEIGSLAGQKGVSDVLNLPALRTYKLRTHFPAGQSHSRLEPLPHIAPARQRPFTPADIPLVRVLQRDLPLVPRTFAPAAREMGLGEIELLDRARELLHSGIMRRFGAVLRHRRVGYGANGMACWVVPKERIEKVGTFAAGLPQVSHCYQRPAYPPRWPYTLFTMIHGRRKADVQNVVDHVAREMELTRFEVLYSTREFKKERVRYFPTEPMEEVT